MAHVRQHVAEFHPAELSVVATAQAGAAEIGVAVPANEPAR